MITIIPPSEFKTIPWKNGKGQTIELAISKGGSLEDFDWRLSMAQVTEDGPFSDFSGYWRHLVLIEGEDIALTHDQDAKHHLRTQLQVASFDGGSRTEAVLGAGPITDFNIITRQSRFQAEVNTAQEADSTDIAAKDLIFIYGLKGSLNISVAEEQHTLLEGHLMMIEGAEGHTISVSGSHWIIANLQHKDAYPVGTHGQPWGETEQDQWLARQSVQRSYRDKVLAKLEPLKERFDIEQYGALSYDLERYPLFIAKSRNWDNNKKTALVTGGVHGYETSGVQGAIRFLETDADRYSEQFNILVAPCVSPWGYETINRWNPNAVDPNRSFYKDSPAEESAQLMQCIDKLSVEIFVHIDLHETTDTDNTEFRPALAARDAVEHTNWNIPDGFYLVGNTENPQPEFQRAIIESVEKVTHIAPPDENDQLIGAPLEQWGVINYACKELGLCAGLSDAMYCTTTEVYPDSPLVDDENCILAQVAAVTGGLDYICAKEGD